MAGTLLVDVVTPTATLYSGEVRQVVATAPTGEFGVLPMHAPMVAELGQGELRLTLDNAANDMLVYAIKGGYFQVALDHATVVTDKAVPLAGLDAAELEEELKSLQAIYDDIPADDEHIDARADVQRDIDWNRSVLVTLGHHGLG